MFQEVISKSTGKRGIVKAIWRNYVHGAPDIDIYTIAFLGPAWESYMGSSDIFVGHKYDCVTVSESDLMRAPLPSENTFELPIFKSCECGKDKHGFANHSSWCPKNGQ